MASNNFPAPSSHYIGSASADLEDEFEAYNPDDVFEDTTEKGAGVNHSEAESGQYIHQDDDLEIREHELARSAAALLAALEDDHQVDEQLFESEPRSQRNVKGIGHLPQDRENSVATFAVATNQSTAELLRNMFEKHYTIQQLKSDTEVNQALEEISERILHLKRFPIHEESIASRTMLHWLYRMVLSRFGSNGSLAMLGSTIMNIASSIDDLSYEERRDRRNMSNPGNLGRHQLDTGSIQVHAMGAYRFWHDVFSQLCLFEERGKSSGPDKTR